MITYNENEYLNYGKCLHITNGTIELVVTLDLGPRIIRAGFLGKDNFMFEDNDRKMLKETDGHTFYNYGGHRLWISPETDGTYYPDNDSVEYSVKGNTFSFTPPKQVTGFQLKIEITVSENENRVDIRHYLTNCSDDEKRVAPWSITMLANGGREIIPVNNNDTGYLPNRYVVLWPYSKMNDPRIDWGDDYIIMDQTHEMAKEIDTPFKMGMSQLHPWAVYVKDDEIFMKRYNFYPDREYPDGNCSFETYSCADFIEMETVGALRSLSKNETAVHDEIWCFFNKSEFKGLNL